MWPHKPDFKKMKDLKNKLHTSQDVQACHTQDNVPHTTDYSLPIHSSGTKLTDTIQDTSNGFTHHVHPKPIPLHTLPEQNLGDIQEEILIFEMHTYQLILIQISVAPNTT